VPHQQHLAITSRYHTCNEIIQCTASNWQERKLSNITLLSYQCSVKEHNTQVHYGETFEQTTTNPTVYRLPTVPSLFSAAIQHQDILGPGYYKSTVLMYYHSQNHKGNTAIRAPGRQPPPRAGWVHTAIFASTLCKTLLAQLMPVH
jgi:hypothetical protein